ncbi:hypothetical protein FSC37_22360 [Piscinibacter aquaticus]|uniref:Uncharacterized protein n=1 Tax=Piscinibacter aquaticus TaxID=392597 RepID=A0A5C6TPC9_9BURK|nr:hypothetical protein FSC37_22360 [Piscinibacter aquaticus]
MKARFEEEVSGEHGAHIEALKEITILTLTENSPTQTHCPARGTSGESREVISLGMLAKIRQMYLREGLSIRKVSRRTGLSKNTARQWLPQEGVTELTPRNPY